MSTAHEFDDELLSAYLDNEVTAAERALVEERLRTDERARQLLDDLRAASQAVKSLPRPRLGRDLAAAVFKDIEQHSPTLDRARVLAMPVRDDDATKSGGSSGSRGLIWASLAVAAALMLMVLRGEQQPPRGGDIVRNSEKKIGSADGDGEAMAVQDGAGSRQRDPDRSGQLADTSKVRDPASNARRGVAGDREDEPVRATPSAAREMTPPPPAAASADADAEAAEEPSSEAATALETIRVDVAGDDVAAAFQEALASAGIALMDDDLPAEVAADVAVVLAGDAAETTDAALAYVVEATPAQIDAVAAALRLREQPAAPAADATTAELTDDLNAESRPGRAWRAPGGRARVVQSGAAEAVAGDAAPAAGSAGFSGGGAKRVVFLLYREQ